VPSGRKKPGSFARAFIAENKATSLTQPIHKKELCQDVTLSNWLSKPGNMHGFLFTAASEKAAYFEADVIVVSAEIGLADNIVLYAKPEVSGFKSTTDHEA
jgi:hypothetical protein